MDESAITQLHLPVEPYQVSDEYWKFGDKVPRRFGLWARHLGDDVVVAPGTEVKAIGDAEVVLSEVKPGSEKKRSWGGVVVLRHKGTRNLKFEIRNYYSVYGHMRDLQVKVGDTVKRGQVLGVVAEGYTPANGWWKQPHLHFAIYTGPWRGVLLPGYWRPERFWRTKLSWWHDPSKFIATRS